MVKITPQVSSLGRYKNCYGKISEPKPKRSGYTEIQIGKKSHYLHIIMAKSFFLPRKRGEDQVDHLTNPGDNRIEVLAWASASKNIQRSYETNENRQSNAPKQSKPVLGRRIRDQEQDDEEEEWTTYASAHDAARQLGLDQGNISAVCRKKQKMTGGYEFVFAEQSFVHTPGEIWRKPYEDSEAMVSNLGNFCNAKGVYSTPSPRTSGYVCVTINKKKYLMHRLVARAFPDIVSPPDDPSQTQVNHINGDPTNNAASNLEWVSPSENIQHSHDTNENRESNSFRWSKRVLGRQKTTESEADTAAWTEYANKSDAAEKLGMDAESVRRCCVRNEGRDADRETLVSTCGYEFRYVPQIEVLPGEVWADVVLDDVYDDDE